MYQVCLMEKMEEEMNTGESSTHKEKGSREVLVQSNLITLGQSRMHVWNGSKIMIQPPECETG